MRLLNLGLGFFAVVMGTLGIFLPVMPSTCFFILAAYFFSKSSKRLEDWILNHPTFGSSVRAWRQHKAMSRAAKAAAYLGMMIGEAMLLTAWPGTILVIVGTFILISSAIYVWSRPTYHSSYYRFNDTNLD